MMLKTSSNMLKVKENSNVSKYFKDKSNNDNQIK